MASEESTIPRIETRGSKKAADKQMLAKSGEGISHASESVRVMPSTSSASTSTINSEMMEMLKMMAKINIQAERKRKDKRRSERIKRNGERIRKKGRNINWGFSRWNCKATWRKTESGSKRCATTTSVGGW